MISPAVRKFVFWQNYLTFHQAAFIRELSESSGVEVVWAVESILPESYAARGYPVPGTGSARVVVAPSDGEIRRLMEDDFAGSIHIFLGIRGMKLASRAFHISRSLPVRRILMSENRYEGGWRLPFRWALYTYDAIAFGKYIDAILCMGYHGAKGGRKWFSMCSFPKKKILPFTYCVEAYDDRLRASRSAKTKRILFVGQLIRRKALDLLLLALSRRDDADWCLTVVGTGERDQHLKELARRLRIEPKVAFIGGLPNEGVSRLIGEHDLLVLPSRFDGWGVVVNEALLKGVPVVCSNRCGASDLVWGSGLGSVFQSGDVAKLVQSLDQGLAAWCRAEFDAVRRAYRPKIMGPTIASYMLEVADWLEGACDRPTAPWLTSTLAS